MTGKLDRALERDSFIGSITNRANQLGRGVEPFEGADDPVLRMVNGPLEIEFAGRSLGDSVHDYRIVAYGVGGPLGLVRSLVRHAAEIGNPLPPQRVQDQIQFVRMTEFPCTSYVASGGPQSTAFPFSRTSS